MKFVRLLSVFLVLLQAGLGAARTHDHADLVNHTASPHLHGHDLIDSFAPAHDEDHQDQDHEDDHDADALDLSNIAVSASAPVALDTLALDPPPDLGLVFVALPCGSSFPLGLPPATAGPHRPLHLLLCHFRN